MSALRVVYEDNHCLAVIKPAGLLTAGDRTGDVSLVDQVRDYLRTKYQKPGNVFVGVVHRLDRPVGGVVVFARTSKAASRLSEQFRAGRVEKVYQALVEGASPGARENWSTVWSKITKQTWSAVQRKTNRARARAASIFAG